MLVHDFSNLFCKGSFSEITFLLWKSRGLQRFNDPQFNFSLERFRAKSKQNTCPKKVTGITENMSKINPKINKKNDKKTSKNRSEKQVEKNSKKCLKKGEKNEEKSSAGSRIYRTLPGYYQKILQMNSKKGKVKCKGRVHANKQDRVHANKPQIPTNLNTPGCLRPGGEYFFRIVFLMFFSSFLPRFWITFSMKFLHCLIIFPRPFFGCYFSYFSHFPDFLFFGRTLADTCFTQGFI